MSRSTTIQLSDAGSRSTNSLERNDRETSNVASDVRRKQTLDTHIETKCLELDQRPWKHAKVESDGNPNKRKEHCDVHDYREIKRRLHIFRSKWDNIFWIDIY
eukprot:124357_1